jgi:hypothetical protein
MESTVSYLLYISCFIKNKCLWQGGVFSETYVVIDVILAISFHDIVQNMHCDIYSVWCNMYNEGKWFLF